MKIGLLLNRDDGVIGKKVDLDTLARQYNKLALAKVYENFTSPENAKALLEDVRKAGVDSVVLAGHSPRHYLNTRQGNYLIDQLHALGITKQRIAYANLRGHVAIPHGKSTSDELTGKAKILVDLALNFLEMRKVGEVKSFAPVKSVLVIGSDSGAIAAAQGFLEFGFRVFMIDKAAQLSTEAHGNKDTAFMDTFVKTHPKTKVFPATRLADLEGVCGNFTATVQNGAEIHKLAVGGIVVSVGEDKDWTAELLKPLHILMDDNQLFATRNAETMPVNTFSESICVLPPCDNLHTKLAHGDMAVKTILRFLNQQEILHEVGLCKVDGELCGVCGTCVKTCPYGASRINQSDDTSYVIAERCKACGNCVTACPTGARDLLHSSQHYVVKGIELLSKFNPGDKNRVINFACEGNGYAALDSAAEKGLQYPTGVMTMRLPCGGAVDTQYILEAFKYGFDGVIISRCKEGLCHNMVGTVDLDRRANLFRDVLRSRNIDPERLFILSTYSAKGEDAVKQIVEFKSYINNIKDGIAERK